LATVRTFAYNSGAGITGTTQVGYIAAGATADSYGAGLTWWKGPDEDLGYVICHTSGARTAGQNEYVVPAPTIGFWRTLEKTDNSFIAFCNSVFKQNFANASDASTWLTINGYWTNYVSFVTSGLILNYDISNSSSYSGSGTTVTDLQGNSNATLSGSPTYSSSNGGYLTFNSGSSQSLLLNTSLNSVLSPPNTSTVISFFVWVYLTGNGVIVTETSTTGWHDSQIEMVSGTLKFSVWSNGVQNLSSSIPTPINNWYYVGFTYDGTNLRGYVNGSLAVTSGTINRQTPFNDGGGVALRYGIALTDATSLGNGGYGNFRWGAFHVYNTALSGANVLSNYNATKSRFGL